MTDEEMAEERATVFANINYNEPDNYGTEKEIGYHAYYCGFLAGLKAGRPQWHTPNVPTSPINKVVLGYIKDCNSKKLCLVEWNGEWWYDANTYNDRVKVIAWCEIPTFDKE